MKPMHDLEQVERWMQAVITHPEGVESGITSPIARQQIDVTADRVEEVVTRSNAQTAIDRLRIYANAYYARLLECLRAEFPALLHALGEDTFNAFAFGYLQAYPSRSYTLNQLGANFPAYLRETRPEDSKPGSWPDFLIDLATLERAYNEVFDGPGVEGQQLLSPESLRQLTLEQWLQSSLQPVPCLRLLRFDFPIHEYISSVRQGKSPAVPAAEPTWLVITRRDYIVRRFAVSESEHALLQLLAAGHCVGEALRTIAEQSETPIETFAHQIGDWFSTWARWGFFSLIKITPETEAQG